MFARCTNSCRKFCRTPVLKGNQERHNRRRSYDPYSIAHCPQSKQNSIEDSMYNTIHQCMYLSTTTGVCMCIGMCMVLQCILYYTVYYSILYNIVCVCMLYYYVCVSVVCVCVYMQLSLCACAQRQRLSAQGILLLCVYVYYTIPQYTTQYVCVQMHVYVYYTCMYVYTYLYVATLY